MAVLASRRANWSGQPLSRAGCGSQADDYQSLILLIQIYRRWPGADQKVARRELNGQSVTSLFTLIIRGRLTRALRPCRAWRE